MVWDIGRETRAKERGMAQAASGNSDKVEKARECARRLARQIGPVCADDVRLSMLKDGTIKEKDWGNWAGSIFKVGFRSIGFKPCWHTGGHARLIRTWLPKENTH